jgi:hypothetical protein
MLTTLKLFMLGLLFLPPSAMHRDPWHHGQVVVRGHSPLQLAQDYGGGAQVLANPTQFYTAATDWCTPTTCNWAALYHLDEVSGNRANDADTVLGANGNLTDGNTVESSTAAQEGTRAADFERSTTEYLICTDGNCGGGTGFDPPNDFSIVAWIQLESSVGLGQQSIMHKLGGGDVYQFLVQTNDTVRFSIYSSSTIHCDSTSTAAIGSYTHVAARFDDTANNMDVYVDATDECSATQTGTCCDGAGDFELSWNNAFNAFDGLQDEVAFINDLLTPQEICRVCACQIDGLKCTCGEDGISYASCATDSDCRQCVGCSAEALCNAGICTGRQTACDSCPLPACNAGAP